VAIVTSDNPRSEDPERIIEEIMAGVAGAPGAVGASDGTGEAADAAPARVHRQVDRRAAIEEAISCARGGDVVVIAGKGHEQGQEFANGRKLPFDDVAVAREALGARGGRAAAAGGAGVGAR
jgi:UDP-N-acetylmuramoyl-L-alanyl-D-glutamate--2,6-diaminopimelate ligase